MAANGVGFSESIVHGPVGVGGAYPYRSKMGMMASSEFFVFYDDFHGAVTSNVPVGWKAAIIDTGSTATIVTTAGSLGATGSILISDATVSEGVSIYREKALQLTTGKRFFMEMRCQTDDVTDSEFQFGLSDLTATTNPEDLYTTTAANLIAFGILDGSALTKMLADKSNSGTSVQTGSRSMVANTWHTLGIGYDGDKLRGYVDGKESLTWSSANSTIPTGVALAPFIGARNGDGAGANNFYVDFFRIVIER